MISAMVKVHPEFLKELHEETLDSWVRLDVKRMSKRGKKVSD